MPRSTGNKLVDAPSMSMKHAPKPSVPAEAVVSAAIAETAADAAAVADAASAGERQDQRPALRRNGW